MVIQQGVVYTRKTRTDPYALVSVDALPNMARWLIGRRSGWDTPAGNDDRAHPVDVADGPIYGVRDCGGVGWSPDGLPGAATL